MKKQIIPVAVVIVILLSGLALWFGLRGNEGLGGNDGANITVFAPAGTEIIAVNTDGVDDEDSSEGSSDSDPRSFSVPDSGELGIELEPGSYQLLANRGEEYYPWKKELEVSEDTNTEFYPILFPTEAELEEVDSAEVEEAFSTPASLPREQSPLANNSESINLYVDADTIFAAWDGEVDNLPEFLCPGENVEECRVQPVFSFQSGSVENLDFFGEYDQMLILDRGSVIAALEIDRRGTQNYQPVYVDPTPATAPAFRVVDGEIYISDGGEISRVVLN
ncbi:MAG: hypothetical protein U5L75_00965 [Candidatus Campbellbacteria bacterium]|nr:hypothetical protein [Candidatus Campbellbacteria bacterium]